MIRDRDRIGRNPERALALDCVEAGIEAADPRRVIADRVELDGADLDIDGDRYDLDEYGNVVVAGGGNAAATAASALEGVLGERIDGGVAITDNPVETDRVSVLPGDHPVPSERGAESTRELLAVVDDAGADDLVIAVITGGGSALMPAPAGDRSVDDLRETTDALLASGAAIHEINAVRKHVSDLKGGHLARRAAPATVVGVVFSDVVGNDLDVIASGPLTPDATTYADALSVLDRYDVTVPAAVRRHLDRGAEGEIPETPSAGDPAFDRVSQRVLADGNTALEGAATVARERGYEPLILSSRIRGEAKEAAKSLVGIAEECAATGTPVEPPAVLLSGGETTVTIRGDGRGGPNQEFALSAALELDADAAVTVASVDTDGIDGNSDAAGGISDADTASPRRAARRALDENDAGGVLDDRDGVIRTGPTATNVNDLRVFVISGDR
jgi:hydroxypyruvate reductase